MKPSGLLFVLSLGFALSAWSAPFQDYPGSIPLKYERNAASDLVYQGQQMLPDQARALYETGKIKDLTDLNPIEDSVIWKNQMLLNVDVDQENIGINRTSDEVTYMSDSESPDGTDSFVATKTDANGQIHAYQVFFELKAHNILLRKALLRKIGYNIPGTIRVAKLRVHFKGAYSKKEFARNIKVKTFLDEARWVTAGEDTDDDALTLQDVVVFDGANDLMYNMARGYIDSSVIQGRRLMNSLLVPYNLVDVPEKGLNLFGWTPGQVTNTQLILTYENADAFNPSYEDARWITRRILQLTRHDWEQIVAAGSYPSDVAKLLVEKLIARRNYLRETLNLQRESVEIAIDPKISAPPRLVDGKLSGVTWPGYAQHFSDVDAESPMPDSELWAFFKSKVISNVISNIINLFNSDYMPQTNQTDLAISIAAKKFAEQILNAHGRNIPVSLWKQDLWGTHVLASREIVTGNYLGTDNVVQLADSVGLAADLGIYIGTQGLPTQMAASGKAQLSLMRTYTHLKPITNIKKALQEPYRNMMVPWLKSQQAAPLEAVLNLEGQKEKLGQDEYEKQLQKALGEFRDKLGVGESLIIQTSLAPNLGFGAGYGLTKNVQLLAQFQDSLTVLSRIQIYRKDDNTIQIYRDPARFNTFDFALALQAKIQVVQFDWGWIKGAAKTNFYSLDLSPDTAKHPNPQLFANAAALRSVMRRTDLELLNKAVKPWKFEHDFSERDFHFNLLWYRYLSSNATDRLRVITPEMKWKDFIRRTIGKRSGQDYESLSIQVINQLAQEYAKIDPRVQITSTQSGNPGDTFKGKSVMRQVVLEGQINQNGAKQDLDLENLLVGIHYRWKGWDISTEKAEKIIDEITKKYGKDIFPKLSLNETKKIQFYAIEVKTSLYQAAVTSLMALTEPQWRDILVTSMIPQGRRAEAIERYTRLALMYQKNLKKAIAASNSGDAADNMAKLVNLVEGVVTFPGFVKAVGGINNLYLVGSIRGFRVGDENGDQPIFSETLGEVGSNKPFGPLSVVENQIGVSEGELLIYWLLQQL